MKNVTADILIMKKKWSSSSKHCMQICLRKFNCTGLVEKREFELFLSARPEDTRRKITGFSIRNFMCQVYTLILSNFVKGKYKIPKDFSEDCRLEHTIAGPIA